MSRGLVLGFDKSTRRPVFMDDATRATSLHIVGAPGTGKTKLIENLIRADIRDGKGVCLIDPHGHLFDNIVRWSERVGAETYRKVLILDPSAADFAFSFNPLDFRRYAGADGEGITLDFMLDAVIRAIAQAWRENDPEKTPRLRKCLYALLYPLAERGLTLLETSHILDMTESGELARWYLADTTADPFIAAEWRRFNAQRPADFLAMYESTLNRLFEITKTPLLRNIVGQEKRNLDFLTLMNEGWVVLVNLSSGGRLSPDNARVLGALLVNDLFLAARCRSEETGRRKPFHVYIDECADFINEDVAKILTEGRKFGLHLTLAHQDLGQLKREGERVYKAVMNSARTKVVFAVQDPEDAEIVADLIFTGEYDMEEPKHLLDKPTVIGYVRRIFQGRSESRSTTHTMTSATAPASTTQVRNEEGVVASTSRTEGVPTESDAYGETDGETFSYTEGLEPIFKTLPGQLFSLDEQIHKAIARVVNQPQRHAFVKMPSLRSVQITVPFVKEVNVDDYRIARFKRENGLLPAYAAEFAQIHAEQEERGARFSRAVRATRTPAEPTEPVPDNSRDNLE